MLKEKCRTESQLRMHRAASRGRFKSTCGAFDVALTLLNATSEGSATFATAHIQPTSGVGGGVRSFWAAVAVRGVGVDLDGLELLGNPCSWGNTEAIKIPVNHQTLDRKSCCQREGKGREGGGYRTVWLVAAAAG